MPTHEIANDDDRDGGRGDACDPSLLRPLLPPSVLLAQMPPAQADPTALHPLEQAQVAAAVASRRLEYAAGRQLAQPLLQALGAVPAPLLNGADRAPLWPPGIIGSITHCTGLCAVAVASVDTARGIGIDIEPASPLPRDVVAHVLVTGESDHFAALPEHAIACADRLVFCAKEAAYKALYPTLRKFLDFPDLRVELAADGTFVVTPTQPLAGIHTPLRGRYRVTRDLMAAAVLLPNT
ncbi:4'-phosphopantetheinyl transferase family protein [Montanilutibacter psychrotolerans]|nr:4'-phosphopantetheinyl transferase superfamily protein [Lysobacter psychrotolerans]